LKRDTPEGGLLEQKKLRRQKRLKKRVAVGRKQPDFMKKKNNLFVLLV